MRVVLRVIAAWLALNAISLVPGTWRMGEAVVAGIFFLSISIKFVLLLGMLALLVAAVSAVELWRMRERGRRLALAYLLLSGAVLVFWFLNVETAQLGRLVFKLLLNCMVGVVLLVPGARRACDARTFEPPAGEGGAG